MSENECSAAASAAHRRIERIAFSDIPGQSKLFLDHLANAPRQREFYPPSVGVAERRDDVLNAYTIDRDKLCSILQRMNERFQAGAETFANIEKLRRPDTVAVLTGQQAGLLTGPLYTIYKALSTVKMAAELDAQGVSAVPIFWVATEDHDLAEVSTAYAISENGELDAVVAEGRGIADLPVGKVCLTDKDAAAIGEFLRRLPQTEANAELIRELANIWAGGEEFGTAFGRTLTRLLHAYGVIIVDPLDEELKRLASPMFVTAVERSEEIVDALLQRSRDITEAGYAPQVLIEPDYFPFFWFDQNGARRALKRTGDGRFAAKGSTSVFDLSDLAEIAERSPECLSPAVMLRPVVQDFLFPTICYFGGGAEVAYFAQTAEVYRLLERPFTPIFHRQSFSLVDPRHRRFLEKFGIGLADMFAGPAGLVPSLVRQFVDPAVFEKFAAAESTILGELSSLMAAIEPLAPPVAANLRTRSRKIEYHLDAVRRKFERSQMEQNSIVHRQLQNLFTELLPKGHLQERTLTAAGFLGRFGPGLVDWIYCSIDLSDKEHRVIYI